MKETLRQAIHILKKDARLLRIEIALMLGASAAYAWLSPRSTLDAAGLYPAFMIAQRDWGQPTWIVMALTAVFLISRVVHAEPIPGHDQFWITRPYRWSGLLAAKILFVILFVNLPVLAAQLVVFRDSGFAFSTHWDGILWSGGLLLFVCALPVAALAALTPGTAAFLITAVLLTGAFYSVVLNFAGGTWPADFDWIRKSIVGVVLTAVAIFTLVVQYRTRRTAASIRTAGVAVSLAILSAWALPLPAALRVQAAVTGSLDASRFGMYADPNLRTLSDYAWGEDGIALDVPLVLTGIPDGALVDVHAFGVRFSVPGRDWSAREALPGASDAGTLEARVVLWKKDFDAVRGQSVTVHVSLAATLLGNPERKTVPVDDGPFQVTENLECIAGRPRHYYVDEGKDYRNLYCRAPFRNAAVHLRAINDGRGNVRLRPDYSPLPSGLNLNRAWETNTGVFPADIAELQIELREPIAHFYREFEFDIELEDFMSGPEEEDSL